MGYGLAATAIVRTQRWALAQRRLVMVSGLGVEMGVVAASWASTAPLDEGTTQVIAGGPVPLHDRDGLLDDLVDGVASNR
jgi:hypothetical protein